MIVKGCVRSLCDIVLQTQIQAVPVLSSLLPSFISFLYFTFPGVTITKVNGCVRPLCDIVFIVGIMVMDAVSDYQPKSADGKFMVWAKQLTYLGRT